MWYSTSERCGPVPFEYARTCSSTPPSVTKSIQEEVARLGEPGPAVEEREDLALVALDEPRIRLLVEGRAAELHPVLLAEPLDLAVAQHRQARAGSP